MSWLQRIIGIFRSPKPAEAPTRAASTVMRRGLGGGRVSQDKLYSWPGAGGVVISPPEDYEQEWRLGDLDANTLDRISTNKLTEMLLSLSPEISRAKWDFQRMFNPGWEVTVHRGESDAVYRRGQDVIDEFIKTLHDRYGTIEVLFGRLSLSAFVGGALFAELVMAEDGRTPLDIATPDPMSIRFKSVTDPVLGQRWEMGQWQQGKWVSLEIPTIRYIPIDPMIGSPYGSPMVAPALFVSLFLLSLLHDLKRVVQQQGYPRLDISIDVEKLFGGEDSFDADNADQMKILNETVRQVKEAYAQLQPEDTYIHADTSTINRPVGTVDSSSLGAIDGLIKALERMAARALKTTPLLMGSDEGVSEANANRQWEIHAAGIKSIQHYAENLLEYFFTLALQAQGIQARVVFRFAELRAAERLRDAQTALMELQVTERRYLLGYYSQEEASQEAVGHKPDAPQPRNMNTGTNEPVQDDGDGQERNDRYVEQVAQRVFEILAGSVDIAANGNGRH